MKPLAILVAVAGIAILIARKTGLLSRSQVEAFAEQATTTTQHFAEAAKSAGESAVAAVSETVSEALPKH